MGKFTLLTVIPLFRISNFLDLPPDPLPLFDVLPSLMVVLVTLGDMESLEDEFNACVNFSLIFSLNELSSKAWELNRNDILEM